jgi:hypothetical protein
MSSRSSPFTPGTTQSFIISLIFLHSSLSHFHYLSLFLNTIPYFLLPPFGKFVLSLLTGYFSYVYSAEIPFLTFCEFLRLAAFGTWGNILSLRQDLLHTRWFTQNTAASIFFSRLAFLFTLWSDSMHGGLMSEELT